MASIMDYEDKSNSILNYEENNYVRSRNTNKKQNISTVGDLQKKYTDSFQKNEKKKGALYNLIFGGNAFAESSFRKNSKEYQKYLAAKKEQDSVNYKKTKKEVEKDEISGLERAVLPFANTAIQAMEGIKTSTNKLAGQTDVENAFNSSDIRYEKLRRETKSSTEKVYQYISGSIGYMAPAIAMPGVKSSLLATGMSSAGNSYSNAKKEGKSESDATKYGVARGALEAGLQKVLGGISGIYGDSIVGKKVSNVVGKVISNKTASKLISEAGSEFSEEYLQEVLEPIVRNITMNEKNEFKPFTEEALYSGMLGALNSGLINGSNIGVNKTHQKKLPNNTPIVSINKGDTFLNNMNQELTKNGYKKFQDSNEGIQLTKSTNLHSNQNILQDDKKLYSKSFSQQVDESFNGMYPERDMLVVAKTPKVLQDTGLGELPITMTQKHLKTITNNSGEYKNSNYHDIGIDIVKQLPDALENPLNILKSSTKSDSVVVITELADKQDRPIIASIKIDGKGTINDIRIDTNVMTSAYGRNNYDKFMNDNINNGNLLYDIDEGIKKRVTRDRVQFPMRDNSSNDNISQSSNIVNNSNMQQTQNNAVSLPINKEMREKLLQQQVIPTEEIKKPNFNESPVVPISKELQNRSAELLDRRPEQAKKSIRDSIEFTKQQLVNKGHYVDKLAKKAGNKELTYKYDKMLSSPAEGHYSIGVAQTDNNGNKIGKSILDIWQPVEKANKVREFSDYLLNKHNIGRVTQGKPVFGENVTAEMSIDKVLQYEKSNSEFKEWAKDINIYNRNQLQNMVDAGLTSQDTQKYLNETYDNYVRINRNINAKAPITNSNGKLKINIPIKKAKGGNQDILPLKESMAQQTLEIKNAIRRNEFGLELLTTLQNGEQDLTYDGKNYVLKNDDGTYSLTVFKDGTPVKIEIDEGLYNSIKPTGKYAWEETFPFKVIQKISNIQRNLLTVDNPIFILTNFYKDIGDAPFNSKYASKFYPNYIKAVNQIKDNGEYWQKYRSLGGEQNTYFTKEKGISPLAKNKAKKFIENINKVNEAVEQAPRLAEFISTLEVGGTLSEAMYNAAEVTTNFKRGGDIAKALNRNGAMFLNASIQGFDKQIRNFTGQNGAKAYINLLSKATLLGVIPSLLNNMLLGDDDDYKNLPDYVKDTYYLFKTSDDNFIRIPKGRVMSIFGSAARRSTELGENENSFDGFNDLLINQVAPNNPLEDNVLAPIISVKNNRSWNGSEIVPRRLQDELPENQYDEKTDAISKAVGKTFKVSPKNVNYLLDQYTGAIGDFVLPMITPKAQQNPLSAKFTTNSTMNNKNVNLFFDSVDKSAKVKNSPTATDEDMLRYKYLTSKQKEMNDLYQEKREIEMSSLSNKEKISSVKEVQKKINEIAKISLENKDDIYVDTNYSKVSDIQFYKNSKNEWQKITDKMLDKQHEVEKIGFLPNAYYKNYVELNSISSSDKDKYVKKSEIINHIINEDISERQKAYLYGQYYSQPDTMELISKINIPMNSYLALQNKIKDIEGIDDLKSNVDNKKISGSKKRQILSKIATLPVTAEQKLILVALQGYSIDTSDNLIINKQRINKKQFNATVFNYINKRLLTKKEKRELLEKSGFTFLKNGNLKKTW